MTIIVSLAIAGIILICLEVILPGMILGILGLIASMTSIFLVFTTDQMPPLFDDIGGRFLLFSIILIFSIISGLFWLKYFDKVPLVKGLILDEDKGTNPENLDANQLIGSKGNALTDMRPVGRVDIKKPSGSYEFVAENGFIKSGSPIKVIKIKNNQFIVREQ